ncbi:MAG TPA: histone deacetylase [Chloroflexia bacterium]|nr:histone deacetylase [Chloroflexia bacterium]
MTEQVLKPVAIVSSPLFQNHNTGRHVESPARAEAVHRLSLELLANHPQKFTHLEPLQASPERIETVHSAQYVRQIERICERGGGALDLNTTVSTRSYETALYAAGGLLKGVESVINGEAAAAFALVRPPGHHAVPKNSLGFCLFNNVAIAARYLLEDCGLERILIVDWDVHHGNGTQDIFYNDPRVLFFSTHQYPLYPGTGSLNETGQDRGKGFNCNLPLPAGCGDAVIERAFDSLLEPLVERFKPEFILVSAGYDAHWRDPIARLTLTAAGYANLTRRVQAWASTFCQGRMALTLEGGYDLLALESSVKATLLTLAGSSREEVLHDDTAGTGPEGYSPETQPLRDLLSEARKIHQV